MFAINQNQTLLSVFFQRFYLLHQFFVA